MALEVRLSPSPLSSSAARLTRFSPYAGRATSAGRRRRRSCHRSLQRGMSRRALSLSLSRSPLPLRLEHLCLAVSKLLNSKPLFSLTQDSGLAGGRARWRCAGRESTPASSLPLLVVARDRRCPDVDALTPRPSSTASRHLQEHVGLALPVTLPPARCRRLSVRISRKLESLAGVRPSAVLLSSSSCARCGTSCSPLGPLLPL